MVHRHGFILHSAGCPVLHRRAQLARARLIFLPADEDLVFFQQNQVHVAACAALRAAAAPQRPLSRTSVDWKIAFCERKAFSSVRNCGRMSSTLAMKLPFILLAAAPPVPEQNADALVRAFSSATLLTIVGRYRRYYIARSAGRLSRRSL